MALQVKNHAVEGRVRSTLSARRDVVVRCRLPFGAVADYLVAFLAIAFFLKESLSFRI